VTARAATRYLQVNGVAAYFRWVHATSRVEVDCKVPESALVALWHDAMFCLLAATVGMKDVAVYVRAQPFLRDTLGLLSALGVRVILSDHRGTEGVKAARRWLSVPGRVLAITLDMGVPRVALPGVVRLARMLRAPLHPLSVSATSGYRLEQWDRCVVPYPGARLEVRALDAVRTDREPEECALSLEQVLFEPALSKAPTKYFSWGSVFAPWPRACLAPVGRNRLLVWSNGALRPVGS
jgi:lysophospholipid acyltransferase (LPLAT)-like uncharacterized protein